MGLEDGDHPSIPCHGGPGGGERGRELGRMVGVVVDDAYLCLLSLELEAAAHAPEGSEGAGRLESPVSQPAGDRGRRQGVEHVVAPVDTQLDLAAPVVVLEEHVAARAHRVGPEISGADAVCGYGARSLGGHQGAVRVFSTDDQVAVLGQRVDELTEGLHDIVEGRVEVRVSNSMFVTTAACGLR